MQNLEYTQAKILIVDDNEDDSVLLQHLLTKAGYEHVTVVNDSRQVCQLHESERYDLILLDHNMPHLSGLEVVELLKEIEQDSYVPVLMVTAHTDKAVRLKVLAAGCKDVITKPYDKTEIINRVHNMLEVRLLHNQIKQQNQELLEHEKDLRTIVDNVAEGIVATDEDGCIKTFNNAAERIFGYKAEEVVGRNINLFVSDNGYCEWKGDGVVHCLSLYASAVSGQGLECVGLRKNSETFPLNIIVNEAMQRDQRVYVSILRDITEEKRAQEVLHATKDMLEERVKQRTAKLIKSNENLITEIKSREKTEKELASARDRAIEASRMKSEFLANVSHEVRTPLNGMLGMLSILAESGLRSEQEDYVKTAYRSGEILLSLINDLLDFSKVEAGKIDVEHITYNIRDMVDDVLQLFDEQIATKALVLSKHIAAEVPKEISGDPWRIRQVLLNLLGNAIKFTDEGSIALTISIEQEGKSHCVLRFEVSDTGLGISANDQDRIFEVFTQADGSTTRRYGGTGLGLTISKKLVELMGGAINVKSDAGKGSTFWFTLPQGKIEMPSAKVIAFDRHSAKAERDNEVIAQGVKHFSEHNIDDGRRLSVLVVEDNEINQKVAVKMLGKLGCDVDVAANGEIAFAAYQEKTYDLIFMDCLMPVMDGFEATMLIRAQERKDYIEDTVPIIAMTANLRQQDQDKCSAAGMDDFLFKPINLNSLRKVIAQWVVGCEQ